MRPLRLTAAVVAVALASTCAATVPSLAQTPTPGVAARAQAGFRVLPYLQRPASDAMTVTWISETPTRGTLVVTPRDGDRAASRRFRSEPQYQPVLEYTAAELAQKVPGLVQGSWLKSSRNYKHTVDLSGLTPGTAYRYTVTQDGRTFEGEFTTAPTAKDWDHLRVVAFSDTETEPYGRVEHREWELSQVNGYTAGSEQRPGPGSAWAQRFGSTTRYGQFTLKYPLNQDVGLRENLAHIERADPDLMLVTGDLAQGGGFQPGWDEFFRSFAGEQGTLASRTPLIPAIGNWETFAALNGGYGTAADRTPSVISRHKYHAYFDTWGDPANPQYKDSYHRVDHGPLTVITLDSTNGLPDEDTRTKTLSGEVFGGNDTQLAPARMSTDTQGEFTREQYDAAFARFSGQPASASDLPNMNPGTRQWAWAERQLADARAKGQIVIVQFHHAAYSSGVHGTPPNHEQPDNQSGVAMRVYTPLLERYQVATVISGHDEMFERSFVDSDGDGIGFHSYDVGVAADGLRGEQYYQKADGSYAPIRFNTHSQWSASADEPETWRTDAAGVRQLVSGGLHYGHLQMDLRRTDAGAELTLTPVHVFPILDAQYDLVRTERRVYDDVVTVSLDRSGRPVR